MKTRLMFLLAFIVIMVACDSDSLQNNLKSSSENDSLNAEMLLSPLFNYKGGNFNKSNFKSKKNSSLVTRTLKSESSGIIEFDFNSEVCEPYIRVLIKGQGNASHLGLFTIEISYCSDGENPTGPILGIQTAANGDQLFTALVGAGFDQDLGFYMDYIYYGGTGRFTNASGEIRLYGIVDYENMVFNNHGEGTLTY